ncbi:MAG: hypothetical protein QW328_05110 [Nitrososphaerota archaeon]
MKRKQINITFTEEEMPIYEWILSNCKKRKYKRSGISRFVKDILLAWYYADTGKNIMEIIQTKKTNVVTKEKYVCKFCGRVMKKISKTNETAVYYCDRCGIINRVGKEGSDKENTIEFL